MKRLMVTLAIVCSSAYMFASELIVKGKIDAPFSVYVNGEKYYSYKSKVDVGYIPSGRYNLEIYTEGAYSELLYDYTINIPRRSTVYATFTGDNKMYISTEKDAPATIIVDLTPYPRRVHAPVPVYHSKPAHHHHAPAPKPAPHKAAPAPKPAPKHDAPSAPRTNHKAATPTAHSTAKPAPAKNEAKPAVKPSSPAPKSDTKSNTTVRTSNSSNNSKVTSSTRTSSTRSTVNTRK
ncbi:MAG: hypothetical protein J6V74_03330 [Bacteroidales bacterium]|nr:hypothetical protein [Bacteroidales bacterium]